MTNNFVLVNKGFDHKDNSGINLRTSPNVWIIAVNIEGKTSKIRLYMS